MESPHAEESSTKPQIVNREGSGDVDNATTYTDNSMNAETDDVQHTGNAGINSHLDPAAQSAYLSLLAAKSQKSNVYKTYDRTRRSRTFIPHWVVEYPWLEFNAERECMFCIYCREYQRTHDREFTNTFVHGATNFRLDSVKAHANSTKHRQVMMVMNGRIPLAVPKPASKQAVTARSSLKIGALFENDDEGLNNLDEGIPTHISTEPEVTGESCVTAANQMSSYIKTLQNIYPHLPLSDLTSNETCLPTTTSQPPTQIQPPPSGRTDALPEPVGMEEEQIQNFVKEEPLSPCLVEPASGQDETAPDDGDSPSTSSGTMRIRRKVPPMRTMWQIHGSSSTSQEEEDGVDDDNGQADCEYERIDAEGQRLHAGAKSDYYYHPTVPVFRQGKMISRLLPKAKRQKLEKILARQNQGEDSMTASDESQGGHQIQSEVEADSSLPKDSHWRHLAESFMEKYNQMCEEHSKMKKLYQTKVASLEKKYNDLEQASQTRERESPNSSSQQDGSPVGQGGNSSPPQINMYSSVIILQVKGQDPINISSTADANFDSVQQSLSRSGIHISLGTNAFPSGVEQESIATRSSRGQRLHSDSSTSACQGKTVAEAGTVEEKGCGEKVGKNNGTRERARTGSDNRKLVSEDAVSGMRSNHQISLETPKRTSSGQRGDISSINGYFMGTGMLPGGDVGQTAAPVDKNGEQAPDISMVIGVGS